MNSEETKPRYHKLTIIPKKRGQEIWLDHLLLRGVMGYELIASSDYGIDSIKRGFTTLKLTLAIPKKYMSYASEQKETKN